MRRTLVRFVVYSTKKATRTKAVAIFYIACFAFCNTIFAQDTNAQVRIHALVLAENGGHHIAFTKAAKPWLNKLAADSNFAIDYLENPNNIDDAFLLI